MNRSFSFLILIFIGFGILYGKEQQNLKYILVKSYSDYISCPATLANTARFVKVIHMLYGDSILHDAYEKGAWCIMNIKIHSDGRLKEIEILTNNRSRKNKAFGKFIEERKQEIYKTVLSVYGELYAIVSLQHSYDSILKLIGKSDGYGISVPLPFGDTLVATGLFSYRFSYAYIYGYEYYPINSSITEGILPEDYPKYMGNRLMDKNQ